MFGTAKNLENRLKVIFFQLFYYIATTPKIAFDFYDISCLISENSIACSY